MKPFILSVKYDRISVQIFYLLKNTAKLNDGVEIRYCIRRRVLFDTWKERTFGEVHSANFKACRMYSTYLYSDKRAFFTSSDRSSQSAKQILCGLTFFAHSKSWWILKACGTPTVAVVDHQKVQCDLFKNLICWSIQFATRVLKGCATVCQHFWGHWLYDGCCQLQGLEKLKQFSGQPTCFCGQFCEDPWIENHMWESCLYWEKIHPK